ncbi:MAG: biotin--[acetyl-CoA-carboxylase] ligase [Burkholderiaceae bacterium]|nr:biotin--[acetyl-CoA-carboxylase] ligase [Burkholderiaceae bacterium]
MAIDGPGSRLLVETVAEIDSTNSELLRREPLLPAGSRAEAIWLVARRQTAGRGRRQRAWVSREGDSLTASFAREVASPARLGGLSLVAGLAVADVLAAAGVADLRLKWPNDLHLPHGKAGGILCEARGRGGLTRIVVGCGLNLRQPRGPALGQPVAGLFEAGDPPDLAGLSRSIGEALLAATDRLLSDGFEPFIAAWRERDLLAERPIVIHHDGGERHAIARGVDADGALLVEPLDRPGGRERILSEEVSVRSL